MKRSKLASFLVLFVMIPATLYLGTQLKGRWFYLTATLIAIETMVPFFLLFETRRPQAREIVTIAVMCALAVISRMVILIPFFKPTTAIIMLTGIALGPEAGFLTGAITALASNFFFSQGPWTAWQMLGYGFGGFLAGWVFHNRPRWCKPWMLTVFGFFAIVLVVGPLLDCSSIFTMASRISKKYVISVFAAGFPNNVVHGLACGATMALFSKPLLYKLNRLRSKYGMLEIQDS